MSIERHATRPAAALSRLARPTQADCLGCADCRGLCHSLLELMRLPELILKPRA